MAYKCLLLLSALVGIHAGPLSYYESGETQCATTCPDNQKLPFVPGHTYEYRYESDVLTSIPGATEESSTLHMTGTVRLEALTACEMAINLAEVSLMDSDPSRPERRQQVERSAEFKRAVQRQPLRFAYVNGRIESICPSSEDETWVLNMKRGIVSAFQNTMHDLSVDASTRETDVSGTCDVEYKVQTTTWGTKTIKKSKDLLTCTGRHSANTILQTVHYDVPSKLQSVPIVKSTHECEQQINGAGIISQSLCKEKHVFRPFSRDNSGATTEVEYTLSFQRESAGTTTRIESIAGRQSLKYDHTPSRQDVLQNYRDAEQTLQSLCSQTRRDVRPDTPKLFNTLIKQMKQLDISSLEQLHQKSSSGSICQNAEKFFHDALPTISTEASISMMARLIRQSEPDSEEITMWLNSLAFIPSATKTMLAEVKPILEMQAFARKASLSVSSLINIYCRDNAQCGMETEVQEIIAIFERNLHYNCMSDEHDKVLMSLKAIGNTGHAENVVQTLNRCFTNAEVPMEIKIAAINAFRRMACTADRSEVERVFRNSEIDSELRINAYLALMQCPTEFLIHTIRRTLESEEVNQVGSFVWTHLTNLMESSSPFKQQARLILQDNHLQKMFDMDKRKFSRNIEKSAFSELLNTGGSIDSNLIWSTESFLPRSASVNLTVDIFGTAINLVEVGGRVEGLDSVLESFFAGVRDKDENVINLENIDELDRQMKQEPVSPKGSYFVRVFGNEIRYDDFHGIDLDSLKEKFNYLQWLIELAKNHEFDYTKSIQLMDTTITLPTAIGLPLKLSLEGTAIMDIKVQGKLDIRNLGVAPRSLDIDGSVKPSASIQINSEMGIDAWIAKTGLKMTNTFHTSTSANGKIQLQDGKIFNLDINMPEERMEVFDFQSKFFITHRDEEREQRMILEDRTELTKCTCAKTATVTGLELCGTLSYPDLYPRKGAPWFPFNGPVSASIILAKKDTYSSIHFEAALLQEKSRNKGQLAITDIARISFNTPGSRVDRELTFDFNLDRAEKNLNVNMKSPWSQAQLTGSIVDERKVKRISANLVINQKDEYGAVAELQKDQTSIAPRLELTMPGRPPVSLGGTIVNKNGRRLDIDLSLENAAKEPITIKGTFVNKKFEKMTGDLEFNSPWISTDINSYVDRSKGNLDGSIKLTYQVAGGKKYRFTTNQSYRYARSGATSEINYSGSYESTRWPGYNTDMTLKMTKDANSESLSLDGGLSRDQSKRLTITQQGSISLGATKSAAFEGTVKLPFMDLDLGISTNNVKSHKELTSNTKIQYDTNKEGNFEISLKKESVSPLKLSAEASLHYPGREMAYSHSLEETSPKNFVHKLNVKLDKYTSFEIDSNYKMSPRHEIDALIKTPFTDPIAIEGYLKPGIREFDFYFLTKLAKQEYSAVASWEHKQNRAGFNTNVNLAAQYQQRKITADIQCTKRGQSLTSIIDTKWDALRDETKKFNINGEIDASQMQLKVRWPQNKFFEINADFKNEKPSYWNSYGDFEVHVTGKSPFRGYEEFSANVQIESGKQYKYHYDVAWNRNNKINFDSTFTMKKGLSDFEYSAVLTSPFEVLRTASAEVKHTLNSGRLNCNYKTQWNNEEIVLELSSNVNLAKHLLAGNAVLTSTIPGYEQMSISGRHSDDGANFQSELQTMWAPQKKASIMFTMSHSNNGWFITNNGEITVTTPLRQYRTNKLSWNHKNDRDEFHPHIELEIGSDKSVFDIDALSKSTNRKYEAQIKSYLNTPYFDNIRFELEHEHDPNQYKYGKSSSSLQWAPDKIIEIQHDVSYPSLLTVTEELKFTSPFNGYKHITYNSKIDLNGPYSVSQELKWGKNKKIAFDANAQIQGSEISITTVFSSPYTETITFKGDNQLQNNVFVSSASLEYAPSESMELTTRIGINDLKKVSVDFKSLFPYLRYLSFDLEHRGTLKQFDTSINFNHNMLREPITIEAKVDVRRMANMEANFNLKTPHENLPFISIDASHKIQGVKYTTDIIINTHICSIKASEEVNFNSFKNFNTRMSLEYCGEKIELSSQFSAEEMISGMATLKAPFLTHPVTVTFNHAGEMTNFQSGVEFTYNPYKTLTAGVEFKKSEKAMNGNLRIITPFRNYETTTVQFNHRGIWKNFQNDAAIEFANTKISGDAEFRLRPDSMRVKASAITPIPGMESVTLNINHDGDIRNFKQEASLEYSGKRVYANVEFNSNADIMGKFELRTPYQKARTFIINFNHAGELTNFQNSASVQINTNTYSGNSAVSISNNRLEARASVKLPQEYSIVLTHNGDIKDFNNKLTIDLSGKKITGETSFTLKDYNIDASARFNTPFNALSTMTVRYKYTGQPTNFNTQASFTLNHMHGNIDANFNKREDNLSGKFEITSSFDTLRNFVLTFDHSGKLEDFENSGSIDLNGKSYTGSSRFSIKGNTINGNANLRIPEEYTMEFTHRGGLKNWKNSAQINMNGDALSANTAYRWNRQGLAASASLNTPFSLRVLDASVSHSGDLSSFENSANLRVNSKRYSGNTQFQRHGSEISGSASVNIPEEYGLTFNHNGGPMEFSNSGTIKVAGTTYNGQSEFSKAGSNLRGSASVRTPEVYGIEFSHNGMMNNFNNNAKIRVAGKEYNGKSHFTMRQDKLAGAASIEIPTEYGVEFNHEGSMKNFNNDATLTYGSKKFTGNSRFELRDNTLTGSASIYTPDEYSLSISHNGEPISFSNEAYLNLAGHRFSGETEFRKQGSKINGKAKLNVPQEYSINFDHDGGYSDFSNSGMVKIADHTYTGRTQFKNNGRRIQGSASINIPDEYGLKFNHAGGRKSFSNNGELMFNGHTYSGSSEFRLGQSQVEGNVNVHIPEEYGLSFKHQGPITDFTNEGTINYPGRTLSGNTAFKLNGNELEGRADIQIPESYGMNIRHQGPITDFTNEGTITYPGKVLSGNSAFKLSSNGIQGNAGVRIPDEYNLSFKHEGPVSAFSNEGTISYPGQVLSGNSEFNIRGSNIMGAATIRLPSEYGISFNHEGPLTSFANEASVRTPAKTYNGNTELRMTNDGISGKASVKLPREYSIDFIHNGDIKNFNNKATVTLGPRKYSGNSDFLMKGKKAEGRIVLRIPDMYSLKFSHQGNLKSFSNEAALKAFGQKYTAGSDFRMNGDTIRGTANIRIPEEYKLTFSHNGEPTDFNTNAEAIINGATYSGTTTFKKEGTNIDTTTQITTPHNGAKNIELRYNHNGDLSDFKQDAYAAAGNKRFSAKTALGLNGNKLNGRIEIATPFRELINALLEINHEGKIKNFKNNAIIEINDKRYTANGEMKLFGKKKQGSFIIAIPEEYGFNFIHKGASLKDWTNKATVNLGDDKINVNSGFTKEPTNLEAVLSVRTPFRKVDSFGFSINHKGTFKKFTTQAEVNTPIRGYKRFSGELSHEGNGRSFKTSGKMQTPFDTLPEASFEINHRGQINNFVTSGALEMGVQRFAADTAYRRFGKNIEASVALQTPFENYNQMGFTMNHNGENGFNTEFKLDTPFQKSFGANFNHNGDLSNFQSTARFETPFKSMPVMNVAMSHRGDRSDFTSSGSIEYGTKKIEGETSYMRSGKSHTGSLRINTPFGIIKNIDVNIEHSAEQNSIFGKIEAIYNGKKWIDGDYTFNNEARKNLMVNLREPHPLSVSIIAEKKNNGLEMNSNFNWNTRAPKSNGRIAFNWEFDNNKIVSNGEFMLANIPGSRLSYEIESSVNSRRYQNIYDGRLKVESSLINWEGTYSHICSPGRKYNTELVIGNNRKLVLRNEILLNQPGVKATFTAKHPSFSNDVVLTAEGNIGGKSLFEGKVSLSYADQKFEGTTKIADISRSGDSRYTTEWHLTHPGSFLDLTVKSEVGNSRESVSGNMEVNYMTTKDRQIKSMTLRSEINKIRDELNMEVITPLNNMRMSGRIMPQERGKQQFVLTGNVDNQEVRAELELNQDKPGADLKLYRNDKMIHVYGKYMDRSTLQFEAYRQVDGARIQEAQLALRLNNSHLLHARAYLRPELMEDLQDILIKDTGALVAIQEVGRVIADELNLKATYLKRALRPILDIAESILEVVSEKAEIIVEAFRQMYRQNDFYIRDSTDTASTVINNVGNYIKEQKNNALIKTQAWTNAAKTSYNSISSKAENYRKYATGVTYDALAGSQKYVSDVYKMVMAHPHVQTIRDTDYWQMFEAWKTRVTQRLNSLANEFWAAMDQYPQLKSFMEGYADRLADSIERLKNSEVIQMADEITRLGYDTIRDKAIEILKEYTQFNKTRFIVWDPARGEFVFELHLPIPLKDLQSLPTAKISQYINNIKAIFEALTPAMDWNLMDTYYSYKPTPDVFNWIPPFKAHATISGNQHFMTFDKRNFEFAGDCSYLLARDFIHGTFSVIVNYDNGVKKSISVHSGGKNIEIFSNYKVNVDGVQSELPITATNTFVSRMGNIIKVTNENGVEIVCDLPHDRCTIDISGWYYGKTAGMLGTYDNEHMNDFMTPSHTIVSTPEQLADSWTVGKKCRVANRAIHVSEMADNRRTQICAKYFRDESSPYRACFRQIDNEKFMDKCLDDMPNNINRMIRDEDTCNVASSYIDECKRVGVTLKTPSICLSCELASGEKFSNITLKDDEVPQSADIAFVVSHRMCNRDLVDKLDKIVSQIDSSLKELGIKKPRYSVVGYAGGRTPLSRPHSHTMDGELFNSKYKFAKALQGFIFNSEDAQSYEEDALRAVEYAARLPFRAGVSKSIILLPCDSCTEGVVNYADVQRLLFQRDIRLHVLTQNDFQLKAEGKSTSYIFGADRKAVFTNKDVGEQDIVGDSGLRAQLRMPKDLCVALTEESSGSVFNSLKLVEGKSVGQKKFLDVLSRVVAKKAIPSTCQICNCVDDSTGIGMSVCKSCNTPSISYWKQSFLPVQPEPEKFEEDLKEYLKQDVKKVKKFKKNRKGKKNRKN